MLEPVPNVLDNLIEGCQIIDFDWRYLYVNDAVARQGQKTKEELLGNTMMEVYPGIEGLELFTALRRCMDERIPIDMENEFTYPDGSTGWFELRIQPVPQGIFIMSNDLTARKRAEQAKEQQLYRLQSLRAIDQAILGTTDLNLALKTLLQEARERLKVDTANVMLLNHSTLILETTAQNGFFIPENQKIQVSLGEGVIGQAALDQQTILVPQLDGAPQDDVFPALRAEGIQSFFVVPLISKGHLIGVLNVGHRTPMNPPPDWVAFMEALAGQAAMAVESGQLFKELERSNLKLRMAYERTIEGWSRALDLRDKETEGHTLRVTEMTLKLATAAGIVEDQLIHVQRGALLHDIGKMGVPDAILLKPDKLTDEEWAIMRQHPVFAYELLSPISYLSPALDIPYCHHEKWDGTGYPRELARDQIPLSARLFAVVDVWDALRSDRPYRKAWPDEKVLAYIRDQAGTHFDPLAVELFLEVVQMYEEG